MRELVRDSVETSTRRLVQVFYSGNRDPPSYASDARVITAIEGLLVPQIAETTKVAWPLVVPETKSTLLSNGIRKAL